MKPLHNFLASIPDDAGPQTAEEAVEAVETARTPPTPIMPLEEALSECRLALSELRRRKGGVTFAANNDAHDKLLSSLHHHLEALKREWEAQTEKP